MKTLILLTLSALALAAQPLIRVIVTDDKGTITNARISGAKAAAYVDSLTQFLATQVDCTGTPQVCTPRYADLASLLQAQLVRYVGEIEPKFPASADKAESDAVEAAKVALEAKRKARADAAKGEK